MKKLFTLFTVALFAVSLSAQVVQRSPQDRPVVKKNVTASKVMFAQGENWYGYYMGQNLRSSIGVADNTSYDCAAYFPASNNVVKGKKIKSVRVWFRPLANLGNEFKIWISPTLPTSADAAPVCVTLTKSQIKGNDTSDNLGVANDIELPESYTVPAGGCYVGYSFSVVSNGGSNEPAGYPIVTSREDTEVDDALMLRWGGGQWTDYSKADLGNLALQVLLEGDFNSVDAKVADFDEVRVAINGTSTKAVSFTNLGSSAVTNLTYKLNVAGTDVAEKTVNLSSPVQFGSSSTFDVEFPGNATAGTQEANIVITKVNGADNASATIKGAGQILTLTKTVTRGVAVEEFTGTGCGWCPRGWIGMEKMREKFGSSFVGLAIHKYNNSDPMYPTAYANLQFPGAPSCQVNRTGAIDPYYGNDDDIRKDFQACLDILPKVDIVLSGQYDTDKTTVAAKAEIEALIDGGPYKIEYALIADGLEGATTAWKQSNYYAQYAASGYPSDIAMFCKGGKYGQSSVALTFNDVVIASSYTGTTNRAASLGTMTAGEKKTSEFTLTLPTKALLKNALIYDKIAAVVLVVNPNGTVENAKKVYLAVDTEGIVSANSSETLTEVARYTVDGRQISEPQSGINIVKFSDGSIQKIMVK